ncbi:MAG: EamA family transporter [Firmicutes bacterium]|nr:EamA family transporter [Bacillota bacterium]
MPSPVRTTLSHAGQPARLRLRTYAFIVALVVFSSVGNLFLSLAMKRIGDPHAWTAAALFDHLLRILASGGIWIGIAFQLLFFVGYLTVLSWADFSFVKPSLAIGYALVTLLGALVLGEPVSLLRWFGIALICSGVALVARTDVRTTRS